ncbi:hypothetical protein H312_02408, partial [Anncaliia algerae PRA339]
MPKQGLPRFCFFDAEIRLVKLTVHSHDNVPEKIEKLRTIQSIKERAIGTTERANEIIGREISLIQNDETVAIMPSIPALRDLVRRERNNMLEYFPGTYYDIPEILKRDEKGNLFLRFDSGFNDPNRIIIFCSEFKLNLFDRINTFIIDGTFRSAPQGFYQLLVLHGCLFGKTYPLSYIIMSDKTEASYMNAFDRCKEIFNLNPKYLITDFERALSNACRNSFPMSTNFGCIFHFGLAIWARIGNLGLIRRYRTELLFKKVIKMIICLSFLPVNEVTIGYKYIKQFIIDLNIYGLEEFLSYFEKNYVGSYNDKTGEYNKPSYDIS